MKTLTRFVLAVLALLSIVPATRAQFDAAQVIGTVTDQSGAVLAKANVLNVFYALSTANDVTGLSSDFHGQRSNGRMSAAPAWIRALRR